MHPPRQPPRRSTHAPSGWCPSRRPRAESMDVGSLAGVGLAFVVILVSNVMEGGNPAALIAPPSLLLVFGGTFGAAMAGGMLKDAIGTIKTVQKALLGKAPG